MTVNMVTLVGHLGRDPAIRTRQSGDKVAELSLATTEVWRDRQTSERKQRTQWHRVIIFSVPLAELAEKRLKKGSQVFVQGTLQYRTYQDSSDRERNVAEVVLPQRRGEMRLLDRRASSAGQEEPPAAEEAPPQEEVPPQDETLIDVDDLPI